MQRFPLNDCFIYEDLKKSKKIFKVSSTDGIEKEEMKKIIENVDYPQSEGVQSDE